MSVSVSRRAHNHRHNRRRGFAFATYHPGTGYPSSRGTSDSLETVNPLVEGNPELARRSQIIRKDTKRATEQHTDHHPAIRLLGQLFEGGDRQPARDDGISKTPRGVQENDPHADAIFRAELMIAQVPNRRLKGFFLRAPR